MLQEQLAERANVRTASNPARKNGQPLRLTTVQRLAQALKVKPADLMASRPRQTEPPDVPRRTQAPLRSDLMEPAPTEHELHQLAARAAALEEVAIIYRAVHAQRASYPTDSEAYRALSHVLDLLRARRGDSGGQPSEAS